MTHEDIASHKFSKEIGELIHIATDIRKWQDSQIPRPTDSEMVRRFTALGSAKTFQKCRDGEVGDLDIEKQLTNYRTVQTLIDSLASARKSEDPVYDDLSSVLRVKRALLEILREEGNARLILVEADSGLGKSKIIEAIHMKYGHRIIVVEALDIWNDGPQELLRGIMLKSGYKSDEIPSTTRNLVHKTIEVLNETRRAIAIDEGHHLGPRCLNCIKTLINLTPSEVMIFAMPTLWKKLERDAYEEARQLTKNRLAERIYLDSLDPRDVQKLLLRRVPQIRAEIVSQAVSMLALKAKHNGNLAFVRDVCKRLTEISEGGQLSEEDVAACVNDELKSRNPVRKDQ